jgi:hypothetical protein
MILFLKAHHLAFFNKPSEAQLRAGNYRKDKVDFQGLPVSIENPRGSLRQGIDPGGQAWSTGMTHHYGYIRGTLGTDGDHFDCFIGPQGNAPHAYIITSMKPPEFTERDEQKAMLGFPHEEAALQAFSDNYDDPRFFGGCVTMPMAEFKAKVMRTRESPDFIKAIPLLFIREVVV